MLTLLSQHVEHVRIHPVVRIVHCLAPKRFALGRKNYLFAGSDRGGERAAALYTLVVTAQLNGLNPEAYLKDILSRIADGHPINRIDELMPWRMTAATAPQPA